MHSSKSSKTHKAKATTTTRTHFPTAPVNVYPVSHTDNEQAAIQQQQQPHHHGIHYNSPKGSCRRLGVQAVSHVAGTPRPNNNNIKLLTPNNSCNDLQFARNTTCRSCHRSKTAATTTTTITATAGHRTSTSSHGLRDGDWICPSYVSHSTATGSYLCSLMHPCTPTSSCGDHQFARNTRCRCCNHARPTGTRTRTGTGAGGGAGARSLAPRYHTATTSTSAASSTTTRSKKSKAHTKRGDGELRFCPACTYGNDMLAPSCAMCGHMLIATSSSGQVTAPRRLYGRAMALEPGDWICDK